MMTETGYKTETAAQLVERLKNQALQDIESAQEQIQKEGDNYVVIAHNFSPERPATEFKYVIGGKYHSINRTGLHVFGYLYPDCYHVKSTAEAIAETLHMSNGDGPLEFAAVTARSYFQDVIREKQELLATYGQLEAINKAAK